MVLMFSIEFMTFIEVRMLKWLTVDGQKVTYRRLTVFLAFLCYRRLNSQPCLALAFYAFN